jgi:8-oxo-dGTP diphosphatase
MNEADFLQAYDPAAFIPMAVAADVVVFMVKDKQLRLLLVRRSDYPARGRFALPGTFVGPEEDLDDAARRAMLDKVGIGSRVRQFRSFGKADRDPRMRIVSIGYMALLPPDVPQLMVGSDQQLAAYDGEVWREPDNRQMALPFDHDEIVAAALTSLRADLDHSAWSYGLLPATFTLRELQATHEAVRGRSLNKPAFRKRLVESGWIEPTGKFETDKGFRPAELYRLKKEHHDSHD